MQGGGGGLPEANNIFWFGLHMAKVGFGNASLCEMWGRGGLLEVNNIKDFPSAVVWVFLSWTMQLDRDLFFLSLIVICFSSVCHLIFILVYLCVRHNNNIDNLIRMQQAQHIHHK
jgi:hypothetical protein